MISEESSQMTSRTPPLHPGMDRERLNRLIHASDSFELEGQSLRLYLRSF